MSLFFVILLVIVPAYAYQSSLSATGKPLQWSNPNVPLVIRTNTSDMSSSLARNIILNSINEWNTASGAKVNPVSSAVNEIKFVSRFPYGSAVLGITELTFGNNGTIQKASILLNDDTYFQSAPGLYPTGQVYLGDVVTHELGHLLGLSHSEVLNASMFFSAYSGQSSIAADDKGGVRAKYNSLGSISGYVKGGSSIGVLGAHIQAISRRTGEATAAISDEKGAFSIDGLELDDTYYLYVSPIKNPNSLPGYFSNLQNKFCPGAYVGSFFSSCGTENDGKPFGITLTQNQNSFDVGTVTINCGLRADQDYNFQKVQTAFTPITFFDYGTDLSAEKAFVGWFRNSLTTTWSVADKLRIDLSDYPITGNPKYLKLSLVSYPFGSQTEYEVSIKQNNTLIVQPTLSFVKSSLTDIYSPDYTALISLSSQNSSRIYEISIKGRKLDPFYARQTFPSYQNFSSDSDMPYLLIASIYEATASGIKPILDTKPLLSDNESCLEGPFTIAVEKTNVAINPTGSADDQTAAAAATCGTIDPPSGGPGSSLPLIILGFLLTIIASMLSKTRKKFLS